MNICTSFFEVGGAILVIAYRFLLSGLTPSRVIQKSKSSILVWPEKEFSILHLIPLYFNLLGVSSNFVK